MIKEKAKQYFKQQPDLRVLFLFDPEKQFEKTIDELEDDQFMVVRNTGNYFALKSRFVTEWIDEKILFYCPFERPKSQGDLKSFPLLDLFLANKELILDDEGELMRKYNLDGSKQGLLRSFKNELKFANVQEVVDPILQRKEFNRKELVNGLFSAFLRFKKPERSVNLLARFLPLLQDKEDLKRFKNKILANDLLDDWNAELKQAFEVELITFDESELEELVKRSKYNLLAQYISKKKEEDPYKHLEITDRRVLHKLNEVYSIIESYPKSLTRTHQLFAELGVAVREMKIVELYGKNSDYGFYTPKMIWEILSGWQDKIDIKPSKVIDLLNQVESYRGLEEVQRDTINILIHAASVFNELNQISHFSLDRPDDFVLAYTEQWYKIDAHYRKAIHGIRSIDETLIPESIGLSKIVDSLNTQYEKFLYDVNKEWIECLNHYSFNYHDFSFPKQYDFYKYEVAPFDQKIVVIISDALRYEAGQELLTKLHEDPKNTAELKFRVASIPSKTSVGMSHLLPGEQIHFNEGNITVDGMSSEGLQSRGAILDRALPGASAVQYEAVKTNLSSKETREIFKNPLVYVYHNHIDAIGDSRNTESKAFDAVEDTINDLKNFVKSLHATLNVARVLITADHGFLYSDKKLEEEALEYSFDKDAIQRHNRYEITKDRIETDRGYTFPLSATTKFTDGHFVSITKSTNRIKRQGAGHQFVHGGGALQELIVPVIESRRKTEEIANKVNPVLINRDRIRIVSSVCKVSILQEKPVSRLDKERRIIVGLYSENEAMSNEVDVILNKTDDKPSGRTFELQLRLIPEASNASIFKLKVFDHSDLLNPLQEAIVNNQSLLGQDF
jgi:hypothetical protein